MGKTLSKRDLKNNKYLDRDQKRMRKMQNTFNDEEFNRPRQDRQEKKRWRPHSEIEV